MPAAEHTHSPTPEEVMAHLDGEATPVSRATMDAHIAGCGICQSIAADLRGVSRHASAWSVDPAPATLRLPGPRRRALTVHIPAWTRSRAVMASLGIAAAVLIIVAAGTQTRMRRGAPSALASASVPESRERSGVVGGVAGGVVGGVTSGRSGTPPPSSAPVRVAGQASRMAAQTDQGQSATGRAAPRGPMVIRTALLRIVVKEFDTVRSSVEALIGQAGGFIDTMTLDATSATARSLRGSLRVPADRLADVLGRLRQMGQVVEDTQGSQDVTDQVVDLDARLASARATEQRLTELLRNRTGRLSDVLDVERELARVRLDIERLDAEKTNVTRRVTYATIDVHITEERKAGIDTGPLSLATRIRVAAADGVEAAIESVVGTVLFVLRAGPVLLLWGVAAAAAWIILRRAKVFRPRASE